MHKPKVSDIITLSRIFELMDLQQSKLPASVLATIKELSAFLRAHYLPLMEQLASDMNLSAWESENIVRSWRIYIALRHWLGCEGDYIRIFEYQG